MPSQNSIAAYQTLTKVVNEKGWTIQNVQYQTKILRLFQSPEKCGGHLTLYGSSSKIMESKTNPMNYDN